MTTFRNTAARIALSIWFSAWIAIGCTSPKSPSDRLEVREADTDASSAETNDSGERDSFGLGSSSCGDGRVGANERCDTAIAANRSGACPTRCDRGEDACSPRMLRGSGCMARCESVTITERRAGDGCCPNGATAADDRDCATTCGNGVVEPGETCDPPNSCPRCPISSACLRVEATGSANVCTLACNSTEIRDCRSGDGCCPSSCTWMNDGDCSSRCGDGVIDDDAGETCEKSGDKLCPTSCDDGDPCTEDMRTGGDENCNVACNHVAVMPRAGDSCCPPGANSSVDSDCKPACGNTIVEPNEECDDGNTVGGDGCAANCTLEAGTQFCMAISGFSNPCVRCLCDECDDGCYVRNSPLETQRCTAIAACIRQAQCEPLACYCGSADLASCASGMASGPCKSVIEMNTGSTDVARIVAQLGDGDSAVNRALRVINCEQSSCIPECRRR